MPRHLGLDPGTVRCGIAVSDSNGSMAFPRPALARDERLFDALREIVEEENISVVVVGRPVALSGNVTASTDDANSLFGDIAEEFGDLQVVQSDERLTTQQAQRSLSEAGVKAKQHREHIDSAAAVIMLEHYLDGHRVD